MFGFDPIVLAIVVLAAVSAGAVAYALFFSRFETDKKSASRINRVKSAESDRVKVKAARDRVQELSKRRKSVQDNLKDLEKRQHEKTKKTLSMKSRLVQAGLTITVAKFYLISAIFASVLLLVAFIVGVSWMVMVGVAVVAGLGLPRWVLGFLIKRRQNELPNALDVIIRSIKSGLPLNDAIRLIATEGTDPVKSEFRRVIEAQQVGLSIPDACARMTLHMPLQEVNFFAIVIAIQSQAGGNLSEAIGNLSKVLRDRRKMKAKVTALSMEAKASAYIIGALPFIVATLVYLTSPNYMMILFTDPRGHFIMGFSAIWMSIGIFVMRKMISFDI
jgi:tight adherence protein B